MLNNLLCTEISAPPCGVIIFGASGDLTYRKLIPGLFNLFARDLLHPKFFILGCARSEFSHEEFRRRADESLSNSAYSTNTDKRREFIKKCFYQKIDYNDISAYNILYQVLNNLFRQFDLPANCLFYLAVPPQLYATIIKNLDRSSLTKTSDATIWKRVIIEKPFGRDLASAIDLNKSITNILSEDQIYRIDHYLGKETVQNILMFRLCNPILEPIWNNKYIEYVEITVAESIGVGHRAGYFDKTGTLRDMFQNHMFQLLTLVAMELPESLNNVHIQNEKYRLLKSICPFSKEDLNSTIIRSQYIRGNIDGNYVPGYTEEEGINPESYTETFVAMRVFIKNDRWMGVPFYLRSGKRLKEHTTKIVIRFRPIKSGVFPYTLDMFNNMLIFTIQPHEGIVLRLVAKHPGAKLCVNPVDLSFKYRDISDKPLPDAYERLLLDAMVGDQSLFIREDCIEEAWRLLTPLELWEEGYSPLYKYKAGSWGPEESRKIFIKPTHKWYEDEIK